MCLIDLRKRTANRHPRSREEFRLSPVRLAALPISASASNGRKQPVFRPNRGMEE